MLTKCQTLCEILKKRREYEQEVSTKSLAASAGLTPAGRR